VKLPESIENLADQFSRLPGIGKKSALRLTLEVLKWDLPQLENFSCAISEAGQVRACNTCGLYIENESCSFCTKDELRMNDSLCVVEGVSDWIAISRSEQFSGSFHVLGGVLNPLLGVGPEELRMSSLKRRLSSAHFSEVILALNSSVEGDATSAYLREIIPSNIAVERIGFGIPMGGNLEYLDALTIGKALENRRKI